MSLLNNSIFIFVSILERARLTRSTVFPPQDLPSPSQSHSSSPGAGGGGLQIRRPPLNTVNPFKSSTLSSSPSLNSPSLSLRQSSPFSGPLPIRQPSNLPPLPPLSNVTSSPTRDRGGPGLPSPISGPGTSGSLGLGGGGMSMGSGVGAGRMSSSPVTPLRPSPPFQPGSLGGGAPGSLGDRRSLASNEGISGSPGVGSLGTGAGSAPKRYSSSFGHRYKDSGASAVSSAGASEGSGGASGSVGQIQNQSRRGSHGQGASMGGGSGGVGASFGGSGGVRERRDSEKKDAVGFSFPVCFLGDVTNQICSLITEPIIQVPVPQPRRSRPLRLHE